MIWLWLRNDLGRNNNWPVLPLLACQPTNSVEGQKESTSCGRSAIVKAKRNLRRAGARRSAIVKAVSSDQLSSCMADAPSAAAGN
jgi:hypothetical protein